MSIGLIHFIFLYVPLSFYVCVSVFLSFYMSFHFSVDSVINIIIFILLISEFFTLTLAGGFSLEFMWQQDSTSFQDSSQ